MTEFAPAAGHNSNVVPIRTDLSEYWQQGSTGEHRLDDGQAPALADLDTQKALFLTDELNPSAVTLVAHWAARSREARMHAARRDEAGLTLAGSDGYESSVVPLCRDDRSDT